ncbi:hypothetical protein GGR56DRAFT_621762 [Xylariaceae sp. FL0804]|nr:hypothetical protein GGR56DRAFT_621762 [Xylariaceae sp. FL0804]
MVYQQNAADVNLRKTTDATETLVQGLRQQADDLEPLLQQNRTDIQSLQEGTSTLNKNLDSVRRELGNLAARLEQETTLSQEQKHSIQDILHQQEKLTKLAEEVGPVQDQFSRFIQKISASVSPAADLGEQEYPEIAIVAELFYDANQRYKTNRPEKGDLHFVEDFLLALKPRVSHLVQAKIHEAFPNIVEMAQHDPLSSPSPPHFIISLEKVSWAHVKIAMRQMDLRDVQTAVDAPSSPRKRTDVQLGAKVEASVGKRRSLRNMVRQKFTHGSPILGQQ